MHASWNESQFSSLTSVKKKKHYLLCKRKNTKNKKSVHAASLSVLLEAADFASSKQLLEENGQKGGAPA